MTASRDQATEPAVDATERTVAFYPGSFDPLTNGHVDIILRGLRTFEGVIVALTHNVSKQPLFSLQERKSFIEEVFADVERVQVVIFEGLMVHAARAHGARNVLRGLRGVADFEYEFQLATMNKTLEPEIETVFLMTEKSHAFVSSKLVREVAGLGGDVSQLVPSVVARALEERFGPPRSRHTINGS